MVAVTVFLLPGSTDFLISDLGVSQNPTLGQKVDESLGLLRDLGLLLLVCQILVDLHSQKTPLVISRGQWAHFPHFSRGSL